jgi:hypothetical protein
MWFKKLKVPVSNEIKEILAVKMWEVRWKGRYGVYHFDVRPEVEVFTSEYEAEEFRKSLFRAFSLLRITGDGTIVTIAENMRR